MNTQQRILWKDLANSMGTDYGRGYVHGVDCVHGNGELPLDIHTVKSQFNAGIIDAVSGKSPKGINGNLGKGREAGAVSPKLNIDIGSALKRKAMAAAARNGQSLTSWVIETLNKELSPVPPAVAPARYPHD